MAAEPGSRSRAELFLSGKLRAATGPLQAQVTARKNGAWVAVTSGGDARDRPFAAVTNFASAASFRIATL